MFYSNNDNYMQDLYYYNQMPSNPYVNSLGNNMMSNYNLQQQGGVPNFQSTQMFVSPPVFQNNVPIQNLNNLYPSIYRILNPVVSKVASNTNQPITEELLNNMTDTVFNIVEGQIDYDDDQLHRNINNETQQSNSSNNNSINNQTNKSLETTRQNNQMQQNNNRRNNRGDSLLRDIIKILIIKELLFKQQLQRQHR